jgi:two-component system cell cycle sensor histidine kinase/response regulator CckA
MTDTPTDELDALVVLDGGGRVLSATPPAAALLGLPLDALAGSGSPASSAPSFAERFLEDGFPGALLSLAAGLRWTGTVRRSNGTRFVGELTAVPGRSERGEPTVTLLLRAKADAKPSSEALHRALFDQSPTPKWLYDVDTLRFLAVNEAAVKTYGYSREEFLQLSLRDIRPDEEVPRMLARMQQLRELDVSTWVHRRKDGTLLDVELTSQSIGIRGRNARLVNVQDVTERKRLEEQLRQTQKMDAIGKLAGGIAHDFNNLLTVILSSVDFLRGETAADDPRLSGIDDVRAAALRAAELTRQLLAFSRQQVLEPKLFDLHARIRGLQRMLGRLLGDPVELHLEPLDGVCMIHADPGSIDQVVMNLVLNSRDALERGGRISLETREQYVDQAFASAHLGMSPGPHVVLSVRDDGVGMDEATLARIFEPFFTTKEQGRGTGLGLSTVLGIVQQSGGAITVESAPGVGSTFRLFFPRATRGTPSRPEMRKVPAARGTETVLLVEDNEQVRIVAREILRRYGYVVVEAAGAAEAIRLVAAHPGKLDLLLTDMRMPHMSGVELARHVTRDRPDIRVLCMSGYSDDAALRDGVAGESIAFLQKPFTPDSLARKVREVLDAPARSGGLG